MYKMMVGPSLTPIQTELVNTHKGAVVKSYGAERLCGMSKTELNASEPLVTCRKWWWLYLSPIIIVIMQYISGG